MKKRVVFLGLITGLFAFTSAQAQIRYGLKGSFLLSGIVSDSHLDNNMESNPGFALGGLGELSLSKNLSVSAELQFLQRNYHYVRSYTGFQDKYLIPTTVHLAALRLPVAMAFQTKGFFLSAGPYVGLNLFGKARQVPMDLDRQEFVYDSKIKFTNTVEPDPNSYNANYDYLNAYNTGSYALRRLEAGLLGNVGYGFKKVRITAFYDLGLTNALPAYADAVEQVSVKNRAFGASLTYFLGIKE